MARIRTVKPEFFRHGPLQDLELANPGKYPMMVFEALWGHCDRAGRFRWDARQLKLDILPFLPFDMEETLTILAKAGQIRRYRVEGRDYGAILTFPEHQRFTGKEAQEPPKYPAPPEGEAAGKHQGSVGEENTLQEGKGKEGKGRDIGASENPADSPAPEQTTLDGKVVDFLPTNIPYREIVGFYNEHMAQLPRVREMTAKRRSLIRAAWTATRTRQTLKFWASYFEECSEDAFLNGTGPYGKGHENWRPSFDYLMRNEVITRVYEKAMSRG